MNFSDLGATKISGKKSRFDFSDLGEIKAQAAPDVAPDSSVSPSGESYERFLSNGLRDYGQNALGAAEFGAYAFPPLAAAKLAQGDNIYNRERMTSMAKGIPEGILNIPKQLWHSVTHPVDSFYERPLSTAMDLSTVAGGISSLADAARPAVDGIAMKTLPGIFKSTAGIPEQATEIALKDPSVLKNYAGTAEAVQGRASNLIDAVRQAKDMAGESIGKIFRKYAGMDGPMQEILDTPIAQKLTKNSTEVPFAQKLKTVESQYPAEVGYTTKPEKQYGAMQIERDNPLGGKVKDWMTTQAEQQVYDKPKMGFLKAKKLVPGDEITKTQITYGPGELETVPRPARDYESTFINRKLADQAFGEGDSDALIHLYKDYIGTPSSQIEAGQITNQDRLQILTRLKRDLQSQTKYAPAGTELAPIDKARNAALKKMSFDVDAMRSDLPGGKKLAIADQAWEGINEIYNNLQKDLANPGKAQDLLARLLKGDTTWLTSGKYTTKLNAIKKVEAATSQKILEPALNEITSMWFKEYAGKGLGPILTRSFGGSGALLALATGNPIPAIALTSSLASTSPQAVSLGIRASAGVGRGIETAASLTKPLAKLGLMRAALNKSRKDQ